MRQTVARALACIVSLLATLVFAPTNVLAQGPIKIGVVQGLTGPFEVYAKQAVAGFKLGLEYGTGQRMELLGGAHASP